MPMASVNPELVGKVLAEDLYSDAGVLLLPRRTVLTAAHVNSLRKQRITRVSIAEDLSEGNGEKISAQLLDKGGDREIVVCYLEAMEQTRRLFERVDIGQMPSLHEFCQAFQTLADQVGERLGLFRSLYVLEGADSYTYRHSLNVGILCTLIARLLKWDEERISLMGAAGFLHDIGKTRVPREILLKPGKLTDEEFAEMKRHTVYGYEILKQMEGAHETLAICALLHHERLDGSGYPDGRKDEQIPLECQVVAVADMFDAICSDRVYKQRTSPFEAARMLWKEACDGLLNIEIVSPFVHYIAQLYVGAKARLNNGEEVQVILIHRDEPMRPLVRRQGEFVDLRNHRQLCIDKMLG
ncbi:HD-GYP domain-containing protein [Brevibacillus sp. NL20B1]|uniref:HD-GYP domain-containing protein n=1 Tax=Brevibacillus sp. NL20B1 TaxID=2829799 RepID=UPI001B92E3CD|nr:HD-GYP domain-containing protein [Brevibacillus sp. NL20B1]MBR8659387.1 HD-GYP domain-containing protein [Brevibacillus sp. NL20B1]